MGLPLAVLVSAADAGGASELYARLASRPMGEVERIYADSKSYDYAWYEWVGGNARRGRTLICRPVEKTGRVKLPIRSAVERTFAWPGRCRRLSEGREESVPSSGAFIELALIRLRAHRLESDEPDTESHDREAA